MANKLAKVVITLDGSRVEVGLDKIRQKTTQLVSEMNKLANEGKQNTKEYKDRIKAVNKLHKAEEDVVDVTKRISQYMKNLGNVATVDLRKAYKEGIQLREGFKGTDVELKKLNADLAAMKAQIDKNTGATNAMAKAQMGFVGSLKTTLKNLVAYAGVFAMFNRLKGLFTDMMKNNFAFSDQLANIRKVSGLAMKDIDDLANRLAKIDTRSTVQELNQLAYTGSKLGFGEYGTEGLESFVKSALKVQNALKEDMGEDAMTALSKMVEVMGLIPKMGVEKAMDATGSAIFKLASTSTATGTNIVEFSKRLMGLANQAGITTDELLAFGSAADAMALMPEVAATSFNKLITAVQKQPNLIENALHIEKGTISELYQAGHMADALVLIFEKMREKGGMNALMHAGVFKDLGSDGARLVATMATMANRVDILNKNMATSREAFAEATAVEQEYNIQMETAEAYMERAANLWTKAFVNPAGVDNVKDFAQAWYDVSKSLTQNRVVMAQLQLAITGLLGAIKMLMSILPGLLYAIGTRGLIWAITGVYSALGGATIATKGFTLAWKEMTVAMKANWISLAIGLIVQFTVYLVSASDKLRELIGLETDALKGTRAFMSGFKADLDDVNKDIYSAVRKLDAYKKAIDDAKKGTKERTAAINNFNKVFAPYLSNILKETSTAKDLAKAYKEVVTQLEKKIAAQAREKDLENQVTPRTRWEADKLQTYDKNLSSDMKQYNGTWLKGYVDDARAAGKSVYQVAVDLNKKLFHLSGESFGQVWGQRGKGEFKDYYEKTVQQGSSKKKEMQLLGSNARNLFDAINFVLQSYSTANARQAVYDKYAPFNLDEQPQEDQLQPLEDLPDKTPGNGKGNKLKQQFKDAKDQAEGMIAKIDEWYKLQETAINDARAAGEINKEDAEKMLQAMQISKNEALAIGRRAVTSGDSAIWDDFKQNTLPKMLADNSDYSTKLLNTLQEVSVKNLHDMLAKFNGEGIYKGMDSGAFFDLMNSKAASNDKAAAAIRAKMLDEIEKMFKQYQFVEQAQDKMRADLKTIGFMTETYEELIARMRQGIKVRPDIDLGGGKTITEKEAYNTLGNKFRAQRTLPFTINIENEKEATEWLQKFGTSVDGQREAWVKAFPDLIHWLDLLDQRKEKLAAGDDVKQVQKDIENAMPMIKSFYYTMIKGEEDYQNAIKKKRDEFSKTNKTRWQTSGNEEYFKHRSKEFQAQANEQKRRPDISRDLGYNNLFEDAEISKYATELQAAQSYYDQLAVMKQNDSDLDAVLADQEAVIMEKRLALQDKLMEKMNEQARAFEQIAGPIDTYAQAVGDALGKMGEDGSSFSEAMKKANIEVLRSFGQLTIDLIKEQITQRIRRLATQKATDKLMQREQQAHQATMVAEEAAGETKRETIKEVGSQAMVMMEKVTGQQIEVTQATTNATTEAAELTDTTAKTNMGIVKGQAKTIGELGWWGIPLAAAIGVLLNGLLSWLLGSLGKSNSNEAPATSTTAATKTKLVSGMLTYDSGNVQRFVGQDGKIYTATEEPQPRDGLVTHPIATTVQGQPALVAENGPEIVVGRETTKAIMMNEPELIRYLANYDRMGGHYGLSAMRAYDSGNVAQSAAAVPDDSLSGNDGTLAQLTAVVAQLSATVQKLQAKGVPAYIKKYGAGGLIDEVKSGLKFDKKYNG